METVKENNYKYTWHHSRSAGYTGKPLDKETGLYYYGARYYNPEWGRFVSRDLIPGKANRTGTLNRYVYCLNNPLIFVDPDGLWIKEEGFWVAEKGDTLWGLSEIIYGEGYKWEDLGYEGDPEKMQVGEKIFDPIIRTEFEKAWAESFENNEFKYEQGGWIITGPEKEDPYEIQRWPKGTYYSITPSSIPQYAVGDFHTHPPDPNLYQPPSLDDIKSIKAGMFGYVITAQEIYFYTNKSYLFIPVTRTTETGWKSKVPQNEGIKK